MTPGQAIAHAHPCYHPRETENTLFHLNWKRNKKVFGIVLTANVGEE